MRSVAAILVLAVQLAICRVEPATKINFPDKHNGQTLVGVGVRKKGPIKVGLEKCFVSIPNQSGFGFRFSGLWSWNVRRPIRFEAFALQVQGYAC